MNWTRGFLRLWVVLAVCWVIVTGVSYRSELVATMLPISKQQKLETTKGGIKYGDDDGIPFIPAGAPCPQCIPDWPTRLEAISIITGPPAALLLLAFAFFWIIRGFKP